MKPVAGKYFQKGSEYPFEQKFTNNFYDIYNNSHNNFILD